MKRFDSREAGLSSELLLKIMMIMINMTRIKTIIIIIINMTLMVTLNNEQDNDDT